MALEGNGILLLDHERTEPFFAGDVVRFADGDLHGFRNASDVPFVYLSVTAPPVESCTMRSVPSRSAATVSLSRDRSRVGRAWSSLM